MPILVNQNKTANYFITWLLLTLILKISFCFRGLQVSIKEDISHQVAKHEGRIKLYSDTGCLGATVQHNLCSMKLWVQLYF